MPALEGPAKAVAPRAEATLEAECPPEEVLALKQLALLGSMQTNIEVSSSELGDLLITSQQTASRRILSLEHRGLIEREVGVRKQLIRITEAGTEILRKEFADYKRLFEMASELQIRGVVQSGLGEGSYYMTRPGYVTQFEAKLGFTPFPGTLNVELQGTEVNKIRLLKTSSPIVIEGFRDETRTFGEVFAWRARVNGSLPCALILPKRTHYTRVVELLAPEKLRDRLNLVDGQELDLIVTLQP